MQIEIKNVVRHAFRHLSYLLKHDHQNIYRALLTQEQRKYVLKVYDEVAEEL